LITQKDLAKDAFAGALKKLMRNLHVDRISVKDIVDVSGYSRKTFYNHFRDKEDLLVWIFNDDVLDLAQDYNLIDYYSFITKQLNRLDEQEYSAFLAKRSRQLYENRHFYRNAFSSKKPNGLNEYLSSMSYITYRDAISNSMSRDISILSESEQDQIANFFSQSYVNQLIRNLNQRGSTITPETLMFNSTEIGGVCLRLYLESLKQGLATH